MKRKIITVLFAAVFAVTLTAQDGMMMSDSDSSSNKFFDVSGMSPAVSLFTNEKTTMMSAAKGTTVYFFAAAWCPNCKAAYKDIRMNYKSFPKGFSLIFVNYDTEKDLAKKYGVTYQHTYVRIDAKGKALKVWSGSRTVDQIVKESAM